MIDWERMNELRDEIGADDLADVVAVFLDETDEVIAGIQSASATTMEAKLHFLKGSALNLGLRAFAEQCGEGELRAAAGDAAPVDIDRLVILYEASKTAFLGVLAKDSAA
jgi:HPt (histidine-containing phosphotransfer) domain-containing protein